MCIKFQVSCAINFKPVSNSMLILFHVTYSEHKIRILTQLICSNFCQGIQSHKIQIGCHNKIRHLMLLYGVGGGRVCIQEKMCNCKKWNTLSYTNWARNCYLDWRLKVGLGSRALQGAPTADSCINARLGSKFLLSSYQPSFLSPN